MDRYPSPFDPTSHSFPRRVAEWLAAGGVSGLLALLIARDGAPPAAWVLAGAVTVAGFVFVVHDDRRLRRLDERAWDTDQWHLLRDNEYRRREGVFLTHTATPAQVPGGSDDGRQWWTVSVQLVQHKDGPLSAGTVKEVEYSFGRQFTEGPVKTQSPRDGFRYETSAHGPLLVLARVVFKNRLKRPLIVERYVDLPLADFR
ncbi:pYEATS domain-containing protein [Isoptericola sp. NPDC019693]|uniref:pYEATS domain-containing protein n=1 Tax=Isoptericola sp. NPDC019693 TaxID=3364009 RepID=UPI0037A3F271